jgi:cell division protein FtsN
MAAKRNKSQARRSGGSNGGMPGWVWLVIGLVLGVGVFLLAPKFLGSDGKGFFRATPDTGATPPAMDAVSDSEAIVDETGTPGTATEPAVKPQEYDFYTLLPGDETALSDNELAERERAEAANRQTAEVPAPPANPDAVDAADNAAPPAIDTPTSPVSPTPPATDTTGEAGTSRPVAAASPRGDARYLLQAGAFAASGDAEALKAKIAFLGLSARVESAQIKDKTVYRVRMGPYGTATELAEAKRKLAGGGLPALAIKAK